MGSLHDLCALFNTANVYAVMLHCIYEHCLFQNVNRNQERLCMQWMVCLASLERNQLELATEKHYMVIFIFIIRLMSISL